MTVDTMFGPEAAAPRPRNIKLKTIKALYQTMTLSETITDYLKPHPTRDPTPSTEGITVTRRLIEAGDLLGIEVSDHVVIGGVYYSFTESRLI